MRRTRTPSIKQLRNKSFYADRRVVKLIEESSYAKPRRLQTINRVIHDYIEKADDAFNNLVARSDDIDGEIQRRANRLTGLAVDKIEAYDTDESIDAVYAVHDCIKDDIINCDVIDMWETVIGLMEYDYGVQYQYNASNQFPRDLLDIGEQPLISHKHEQQTYKAQQQIVNNIMAQLRANPVN